MSQPGTRTVPFQDPPASRSPQFLGAIVPAVLALLLILFNWDEVGVNILAWDVDLPLGLVMLLLYALGLLTGRLLPWLQGNTGRSRVRVITNDARQGHR